MNKIKDVLFDNKFNYIVSFLFLIVLILFLTDVIINTNKPFEQIEVNLRVNVSEEIGIVINDNIVDFGNLPVGMNSNKKVILQNDFNFPVKVQVFLDGNISELIYGESEVFLLGDSQEVYDINIYLPKNLNKSVYTGKIYFKFFKP